ncbi:MAG: hypothetical protein Q4E24_10240 [bacterium]|nr:hypothetical protein [bacterium]
MDLLDVKTLLEKAVKSADSIIITAKKQEKGEIKAAESNALTNAYRSAGNLYLAVVQAVEGSTITIQSKGAPTELSQADKERLDRISDLLSGKPSKQRKRKKQEG